MMSHTTQLARWLHKQLLLKYTFAGYAKPFEMRYSTVKADFGLLDAYTRERPGIEALENAFADLKSKDVLSSYERNDTLGPRKKLIEVTFKIPSSNFVREMKASNKRLSEAQRKGQWV